MKTPETPGRQTPETLLYRQRFARPSALLNPLRHLLEGSAQHLPLTLYTSTEVRRTRTDENRSDLAARLFYAQQLTEDFNEALYPNGLVAIRTNEQRGLSRVAMTIENQESLDRLSFIMENLRDTPSPRYPKPFNYVYFDVPAGSVLRNEERLEEAKYFFEKEMKDESRKHLHVLSIQAIDVRVIGPAGQETPLREAS